MDRNERRIVPSAPYSRVSILHQLETPLIVPRPAAFAMTTKAVGNQLQKLAAQWPADPFRPHLQLKTFLESLSRHPGLTDEAVTATRSLLQNDVRHKVRRCPHPPGS
jgi:hypothetical protein